MVLLKEIGKLIVFYFVMQKIPDDIWSYIFSFLLCTEYNVSVLMEVSKTWNRCFYQTRELRFGKCWWVVLRLKKFSLLTKLKVYHCEKLDFSHLINLTHLTIRGPYADDTSCSNNYHHLPLLTNLTTLSIKQNNHIPNGVFLRFSSSLRKSITSLSLNERMNNNVLSIFTNLKKLNLSTRWMREQFDVSRMKYLTELRPYYFGSKISIPTGFNGHVIVKAKDSVSEYIVENGIMRETKRIIRYQRAFQYRELIFTR